MKSYTILLFLGLIMLNGDSSSTPALARADTTIEDLGEEIEKKPDSKKKRSPKGGATKTPEERDKIKREKREQNAKLEACLVITRSYYKLHEDRFDTYLKEHKSTQGMKMAPAGGVTPETPKELKEEIEKGRQNHQMLLSKINGQMLLQCDGKISEKQIKVLQKHRAHPEGFDALQEDYAKLVDIDLTENDDVGLTGVKLDGIGKVVYSNSESKILQQVEDINESLNREQQEFNQKKAKKAGVNIAGFETTNLSEGQQLILMICIYAGIMFALYFAYQKMLVAPEEEENARKAHKEQKRAAKQKKKA